MAIKYHCKNKKRRNAVYACKSLNGLDFLEVDVKDQKKLYLHFLFNPGSSLTGKNFIIEGGSRIRGIKIIDDPETIDGNILALKVDTVGDFSTYTLRLVDSSDNPVPPTGFDLKLCEVDFSFRVNCSRGLDCQQSLRCPQERSSEPQIDYLAKDYASFRQLLLDRLAVVMPGWNERNPSDLMVALVELLASAGDYLSYYQDAVSTEAYLETALKRISIRRHVRLLDYPMHEGCNSRVWVRFETDKNGLSLHGPGKDENGVFTGGTMLFTQCGVGPALKFADNRDLVAFLSTHNPEVFELMHEIVLHQAHNEIHFYTWGDDECCLPKGATSATLIDEDLCLNVGDVLILEEMRSPITGSKEDADPSHKHAVRLIKIEKSSEPDPLTNQSYVEIAWGNQDALPFALCLSKIIDGTPISNVSIARGNVALADHGRTLRNVERQIEIPTRRLQLKLEQPKITYSVPYDDVTARGLASDTRISGTVAPAPASVALIQDPREAKPRVELFLDECVWLPVVRDLMESDRFEKVFVVEMDDERYAHLRFGEVPLSTVTSTSEGKVEEVVTYHATYRIGNGKAGNIGAGAISHIVITDQEGIKGVCNPLPSQGGTDPEPVDLVKLYAPQAFRVQKRAVTEEDFAEVASLHPEVQKVVAMRRWTGSWYTIFVTVDRKEGLPVDENFKEDITRFLESYRMAGVDIEVNGPVYVPLDIALEVCVKPGYLKGDVLEALLEAFSNYDMPDGKRGFFHPDNFTFQQPVYLSSIIVETMKVAGVDWVYAKRFQRWGVLDSDERDKGWIEMGKLEIARLDNDPNEPENGRIEFLMQGGL